MHGFKRRKPQKILLLTNDFPPRYSGGISNVYFNLCKNDTHGLLKAIAPDCEAAKRFDEEFNLDTVRVRVPTERGILLRIIQLAGFLAAAIIESFRNDVIAIWCGHVYLTPVAYVLKKLRGLPYFLFMYGGEERVYLDKRLKAMVFRYLIGNSDYLLGCSSFVKGEINRNWGYKGPIHVLNPGVDTDRFRPCESLSSDRDSRTEFVLLTVGTLLNEHKGQDKVIEALVSIREEIPAVKYYVIGDGPERGRLQDLAFKKHGLDSVVEFLGFIKDSELPMYFNKADVFIMPSRVAPCAQGTEGFGIVYLEANACGKPVIGGNAGGVPDAILDGETGLLVDPEDADDIARAVIWLYNNPDARASMGARGRERALDEFQWDSTTERFIEIIRKNLNDV
jgi:phosphatidylinositol alpha-1,6-mannosyltransferase